VLLLLARVCHKCHLSCTYPVSYAQLIRLDSERRISPDLRLAFYTTRDDDKVSRVDNQQTSVCQALLAAITRVRSQNWQWTCVW
jgi:hypothetical protein